MSIELFSTRGSSDESYAYSDAVISGVDQENGGLYTPREIRELPLSQLEILSELEYAELTAAVKSELSDCTYNDMFEMAESVYTIENFSMKRGQVVPVERVEGEVYQDVYIAHASEGPTLSFKDNAMQLLAAEQQRILEKKNEHRLAIGATSGDTGAAAAAAISQHDRLSLLVLSPQDGMSEEQKRVQAHYTGENVVSLMVDESFDDCQDIVKALQQDESLEQLVSMNSINWGRVSAQVVYFFSSYFQTVDKIGEPVDFIVPTGNAGNIYAGHIAKRMGLPVRNLIVVANENSSLDDVIEHGMYRVKPSSTTIQTNTPSMDIAKPSNFERIVYEIFEFDSEKTKNFMTDAMGTGAWFQDYGVPSDILLKMGFDTAPTSDKNRAWQIRNRHQFDGSLTDPHTAAALRVASLLPEDGVPKICIETALPIKFRDIVRNSIGDKQLDMPIPERFSYIDSAIDPDIFENVPADLDVIRAIARSMQHR